MAGRNEYKYLVPNEYLDRLRADLRPYMELDKFAKNDAAQYTVRSVYYDSPGFDAYDEKIEGLKVRKKFRIRGYNQPNKDSIVFLEVKRKLEAFISKNRAPLRLQDLDKVFSSPNLEECILSFGGTKSEQDDAKRFLYHYYMQGLRPAVLVVYDREPFHGRFDKTLRLTFDKNLRGAIFPSLNMLYNDECLKLAMSQYFIFEVKFFRGALPVWLKSMIRRYELKRMALSKFTICLDKHRVPRKALQMRSRALSPVWDNPGLWEE